jgi:signal transduction histidine kinase
MDLKDDVGQRTRPRRRRPADPAAQALALDLLDEFNSAAEAAELVQLVLHRAVVETRSDRGVISWIDGGEMIVAGCYDPFGEPLKAGRRWPLGTDEISALALASGLPETGSFDMPELDMVSPALAETYAGLRHLLVVPVTVAGEDIAILCVSRRRSEAFTAEDREVMSSVAEVAAQPLRAARLDDMLGSVLTELSERLAGAESVERIKTDILRLASHELRTPLTVLHGYLSLIRAGQFGDIPAPLDRVMHILERRTEEMNGLVNDMLVAARVEDHTADTESETIDLRTVVREAADAVAPRASAEHRMRIELPAQPVLAHVDSERVVLAVRNILENAIKYSPQGGEVVCSLSETNRTARVRVADHGLGIAPEDRDKLFTRFGRVLTTANSHIPGIGLGLYFTREVARHHGGDVAFVDVDGPGSVFELTLPLQGEAPA